MAGDEDNASRLRLAREAAQAIYRDPFAPVLYEPQGAAERRAAVTALSECFSDAGGTVAQIVANASAAAQVLSDDRLQGVSEIVQNADDAGATFVRFYQTEDWLIAVHNGSPLTLRDVHALAAPWLTTKTDQAPSTGRFGIGLLTLHILAPAFEIHSEDYHLMLGEPTLAAISPIRLPDGLATPHDTIAETPWNAALAGLVGELWAGAVLDLFQQTPQVGWQLIPLSREHDNEKHVNQLSVSFAQRLEELINDQSDSTIPTALRLPVDGALIPVSELAIEDRLLEGLPSYLRRRFLPGRGLRA